MYIFGGVVNVLELRCIPVSHVVQLLGSKGMLHSAYFFILSFLTDH